MGVTGCRIDVPAELTEAHLRAISRYLVDRFGLSDVEWSHLLVAMDILRRATLTQGNRRWTFAALYRQLVDDVYADGYIAACYGFADVATEGERLRAAIARQIVHVLRERGFYSHRVPESQILAAFMVYWWESFARGYAFEVEIFRDLVASGIVFTGHALRSRRERWSRHDLVVLGYRGDIKLSTYFLHVRRNRLAAQEFCITRLYHRPTHQWKRVVLLREHVWRTLNGEPRSVATPDDVWDIFPGAARLRLQRQTWVVVLYEWWKERVYQLQSEV